MSNEQQPIQENEETKKHIRIEPGTTRCWHCKEVVKLEQAWHSEKTILAKYFCNKCNQELNHY